MINKHKPYTYYKCCKRSHQAFFHNLGNSAEFFFIHMLENTEVEVYDSEVDDEKSVRQTAGLHPETSSLNMRDY